MYYSGVWFEDQATAFQSIQITCVQHHFLVRKFFFFRNRYSHQGRLDSNPCSRLSIIRSTNKDIVCIPNRFDDVEIAQDKHGDYFDNSDAENVFL